MKKDQQRRRLGYIVLTTLDAETEIRVDISQSLRKDAALIHVEKIVAATDSQGLKHHMQGERLPP